MLTNLLDERRQLFLHHDSLYQCLWEGSNYRKVWSSTVMSKRGRERRSRCQTRLLLEGKRESHNLAKHAVAVSLWYV